MYSPHIGDTKPDLVIKGLADVLRLILSKVHPVNISDMSDMDFIGNVMYDLGEDEGPEICTQIELEVARYYRIAYKIRYMRKS